MVTSEPALTMTAGLMVTVMSESFAGHGPIGSSVVNVNITLPEVISSIEGVYTAFRSDVLGLKVPVPDDDHCAELASPPKEPFKFTASPSQITSVGPPASALVVFLIVI